MQRSFGWVSWRAENVDDFQATENVNSSIRTFGLHIQDGSNLSATQYRHGVHSSWHCSDSECPMLARFLELLNELQVMA